MSIRKAGLAGLILLGVLLVPATAMSQMIVYVDAHATGANNGTSWMDAYPSLQDALTTAAASGGTVTEIWAAVGTYRPSAQTDPSDPRSATFQLIDAVAIYGGFAGGETNRDDRDPAANVTIVSGDLADDDAPVVDLTELWNQPTRSENSYHVITASSTDTTAILDGFTVTGGNANGDDYPVSGGAGMVNYDGSPTVAHCRFVWNSASVGAAGVLNSQANPSFSYCTFLENSAPTSAAMSNNYCGPQLVNCAFISNLASPNTGGAIRNNNSNPTLINCIFTGNLCGNSGGAINNYISSPVLVNCTFAANVAAGRGGAIYNYQSSPALTNCILWGNIASLGPQMHTESYNSYPTVTYTCIQGGLTGTGNISEDPQFVDPDGPDCIPGTEDDNLRLRAGSPCLDTGNNEPGIALPSTDLDGKPRIVSETVDMGAYEEPYQALVISDAPLRVAEGGTASFAVALAMDPLGPVQVAVSWYSGDADIGVADGALLTFDSSNFSVPQTVTLAAAHDADWWNGEAVTRVSASSIPTAEVIAGEVDADSPPSTVFVQATANGANLGTSWADAFACLQDALTALASLDQPSAAVWVAAGTYTPDQGAAMLPGDRTASFQLLSGVAVYGGFAGDEDPATFDLANRDFQAHTTTLSGDLNDDDGPDFANNTENSYRVVSANDVNASGILDGFTITGGNANKPTWPDRFDDGAGIWIDQGGPTLANCRFVANSAAEWGGGLCATMYSTPTLIRCAFSGNAGVLGGAIYFEDGSEPTVTGCVLTDNHASLSGGGIFSNADALIATNCVFRLNSASAGGGITISYGSATLDNCAFSGNSASGSDSYHSGGAIFNTSSYTTLTNCSVTGNSGEHGSAMLTRGGYPAVVTNCIFWGNGTASSGGIYAGDTGSHAVINCSCVQGGYSGTGNISDDPFFVDAAGPDHIFGTDDDNLRLRADSPCLNTGTNSPPEGLPLTDLDDNPRIIDGVVDMGAYEGSHQAFVVSASTVPVPEKGTAQFTVRLAMNPLGLTQVTVSRCSGDPDISVAGGSVLTFDSLNFSQPQTVTLAAALDPDHTDDSAFIQLVADGVPTATVIAQEIDLLPPLFVRQSATGANDGSTWGDAYTNLQDALAYASSHGTIRQIWVAGETYTPDRGTAQMLGDRLATFQLLSGVAIYGGFAGTEDPATFDLANRNLQANPSILSGDLNGDDGANFANNADNSCHVVTATGTDASSVLDGFTITAGNADGTSPDIGRGRGGGVYAGNPGQATLTNCRIIGNYAKDYGGGVYRNNSSTTITGCIFQNNKAAYHYGGGLYNTYGSPTITDCTFDGNSANRGGGMANDRANSLVIRCTFQNNQNSGAGIYNYRCDPTIRSCAFLSNSAGVYSGGGGMYNYYANPVLVNCLFVGNYGSGGGALYDQSSNPTVTNCTFYGNEAKYSGGGMYEYYGSAAQLVNCVLWGNLDSNGSVETSQIYRNSSTPTVNYSCVQGWSGTMDGVGNLGSDPLFVNAATGNFHLSPPSPCIDAGDPASDYSLEPEPDGGRINMGAYGNTPEAETKGWLYIDDYGQVSKTRVGRTLFEYQLNVTMRNASENAEDNVVATLLQVPSNMQIIDDTVNVGSVPAGGSVVSQDTFAIRVDRTSLVSPLPISWQVTYAGRTEMFTAWLDLDARTGSLGDLDGDGDVDLSDFSTFQACFNGPNRPPAQNGCDQADSDGDADVDLTDFSAFQGCFNGPNRPPACE
ncbi:MAG: hypothetical protein JXA69_16145 [Phycisphaerae bacterium]|nr:hypothetical protein [Phycisphaerae bacterium]